MTEAQMIMLAKMNCEEHLGDVITEDSEPADIREEAFLMAFDKLVDYGVDHRTARRIASDVADTFL